MAVRAGLPAAGAVSRAGMMRTRLILWGIAILVLLALPPFVHRHRPAVLPGPRAAHHDPRHRGGEPEPDPRLRRPGVLRPCRVPRHRRVHGRHHGLLRPHQRLAAVAGRHRGLRRGGARHRRGVDPYQRHLLHHDHARLHADALLPRHLAGGVRRRRRHAAQGEERLQRPGRPARPGGVLLPLPGADAPRRLSRLQNRELAIRHGAARRASPTTRARERSASRPTRTASRPSSSPARCAGSPARSMPTTRTTSRPA